MAFEDTKEFDLECILKKFKINRKALLNSGLQEADLKKIYDHGRKC